MTQIRKGSDVKAAKDITWKDILGDAASSILGDKAVILKGAPGKVLSYSREMDAYEVNFPVGGEWWLEKDCLTK